MREREETKTDTKEFTNISNAKTLFINIRQNFILCQPEFIVHFNSPGSSGKAVDGF